MSLQLRLMLDIVARPWQHTQSRQRDWSATVLADAVVARREFPQGSLDLGQLGLQVERHLLGRIPFLQLTLHTG